MDNSSYVKKIMFSLQMRSYKKLCQYRSADYQIPLSLTVINIKKIIDNIITDFEKRKKSTWDQA